MAFLSSTILPCRLKISWLAGNADSVVKKGKQLPQMGRPRIKNGRASADYSASKDITKGELLYTKDIGVWNERFWESMPAEVSRSSLSAKLPAGTVAFYFNATDGRGLMVSSEYLLVE